MPRTRERLHAYEPGVKDLFAKKAACLSSKLTARADRRFQFQERSQDFIRVHTTKRFLSGLVSTMKIVRPRGHHAPLPAKTIFHVSALGGDRAGEASRLD